MTRSFPPVELAVRELIEDVYPESAGKVGGSLSYVEGDGFYIFVGLVSGETDATGGQWAVDVDVFSDSYLDGMRRSLDLEAFLMRSRIQTSVMRLDNCFQLSSPSEIPWDDENAFRISATYMFTARRSG